MFKFFYFIYLTLCFSFYGLQAQAQSDPHYFFLRTISYPIWEGPACGYYSDKVKTPDPNETRCQPNGGCADDFFRVDVRGPVINIDGKDVILKEVEKDHYKNKDTSVQIKRFGKRDEDGGGQAWVIIKHQKQVLKIKAHYSCDV